MKKILFLENNKVCLVNPAKDISIDDLVSSLDQNVSYLIVEEEDLPSKDDLKYFFGALTADFDNKESPNIRIDFNIAKELTKERLRNERLSLFQNNDIILRDAILDGDDELIKVAKQERDRLRNITEIVDTVDTLDLLKQLHP